MALASAALPRWKPVPDAQLFAPGTPVSEEQAAVIWRELASRRWEVLAAADANGWRHAAIARVPSNPSVDFCTLQRRERQVLALLARGFAPKIVAAELSTSPARVSAALHSARVRLEFGSAHELVRAYRSAGGAVDV